MSGRDSHEAYVDWTLGDLKEIVAGLLDAPGGGPGGTTDHGELDGLEDDDHPQYLTEAEADALYALLSHPHAFAEITGTLADGQIPADIARDAEVAAAVAAHEAAGDPHPGYTTTAELATAVSNHEAAANPHPTYLTQTEGEGLFHALTTDMFTQAEANAHTAAADPHPGYRLESVPIAAADVAADVATQAELDAVAAAKQNVDQDLTDIAALAPDNDSVMQRKAGAWTGRTIAQLLTDLAAPGTTFQPLDADLTAIAALTTTAAGRALLALTDPNADRLLFWDDSAGAFAYLTLGTNLSISDTTLNASGGGGGSDPPTSTYAPGSYTIADGTARSAVKRQSFTTTQRLTISITGRLSISN